MRFIRFALFTNTLKFAQNNCNCYDIVTINKNCLCHSGIYNCYDNCYDDKHKNRSHALLGSGFYVYLLYMPVFKPLSGFPLANFIVCIIKL